jgi:2'-5' RNA ligase
MEAHITVLVPFRHASALDDETSAVLASTFAGFEAFSFALEAVRKFEDGTVYLAPTPAEPLVALTEAVTARFPEHPPYGGSFDAIVPHLTVGRDVDGSVAEAAKRLPLPIHSRVRSVVLVERGDDLRWQKRRSCQLA